MLRRVEGEAVAVERVEPGVPVAAAVSARVSRLGDDGVPFVVVAVMIF